MPNFRVDAKTFFLTYPRAEAIQSKESLLEFLLSVREPVTYCVVSREHHADEGIHYHAIISYPRRFNLRSESFYDAFGCHPNIQSAKSFEDLLKVLPAEERSRVLKTLSNAQTWQVLPKGTQGAAIIGATEATKNALAEEKPSRNALAR